MKIYNKPIFLKGGYPRTANINSTLEYLPLPAPHHNEPYRLDIKDIDINLHQKDELTFHLVGDTGSFKDLNFQKRIANEISKNASQGKASDFLYHLGDVVYHHGEESEYPQQFFEPYEDYPGEIFAIAGNHDADINPDAENPYQSLDAFMRVFCDTERTDIPFSNGSTRKSMTQPYVYWTLETPLVNIIGLYGNIAKFGAIDDKQREWFIKELKNATLEQDEKALFIAVHQSPFSADINHGSSLYMIDFLESAFNETGVYPDMILSGHVHNYQRFHKTYENDKTIPYIVAGAGGYAILHPIAQLDDPMVSADHPYFDGVKLDRYCDDKHGFMKMNVKRTLQGLEVRGDYFVVSKIEGSEDLETSLFDSFEFSLDRFREEAGCLI